MLETPTPFSPGSARRQTAIHVLSLGAGVQSSTLALMAAHGEITPMPEFAIFADTQDEPIAVYKWLDWLEERLPFKVERVTAGKLIDSATDVRLSAKSGNTYTKTGLPVFTKNNDGGKGIGMRQCTRTFKIEPIQKFLRQFKAIGVIQWIGISRDEAHRMKPSKEKWLTSIWPLVERKITRDGCLSWMEKHSYPTPPRSACDYCPFHNDEEWMKIKKDAERFAKIVATERRLQKAYTEATALKSIPFFHRSRVPIDQVIFDVKQPDAQISLFGNECEGMCGV